MTSTSASSSTLPSPIPSTSSTSPPPTPSVTLTPTPSPALLAYESVRFSHAVQYNKQDSVAFLTSHRVLVLSSATSQTLFSIPTSIITGHNISAAKSAACMLRLLYTPPPSTTVPPTAASDMGAAKAAILQFTSDTATDDRQMWKEAIAQVQERNKQHAQVTPSREETIATLPPLPTPTVKVEPKESTPTATASTSSSSLAPAPPRAASPSPSPSPSPTPTTTTISLATLEVRASLLARHPHLKQLHSDLVLKHILSEEEFWSSPSHAELVRRETEASTPQTRGLSSSMSADILPSVTSTSVHFRVDANIMHAIFLHSPAVHRAYGQLVPTAMTEKEFWTKYFRSRYVHAGRAALLTGGVGGGEEGGIGGGKAGVGGEGGGDAFARTIDAAERKVEEEEAAQYGDGERRVKAIIQRKHIDPSVDLTSSDADASIMTGQPSILDHDHSNSDAPRAGGARLSKKSRAQAELVKKFNRHGMLVLDSTMDRSKERLGGVGVGGEGGGAAGVTGRTVKQEEEKYHTDLRDSLTLTDLQEERAVHYDVLPLQRKGFFTDAKGGGAKAKGEEGDDSARAAALQSFVSEVDRWTLERVPEALPSPDKALALLQEVSLASRAMNRAAFLTQQINKRQNMLGLNGDDSAASSSSSFPTSSTSTTSSAQFSAVVFSSVSGEDVLVPVEFQVQLRKHFLTCQELCRHFYACFPVTAKTASKVQRIKMALDAAYKGLLLLRAELNAQGQAQLTPMLAPLLSSIEQCHTLHTRWQAQEKLKQGHIQRQRQQQGAAEPTQQAAKKIKAAA